MYVCVPVVFALCHSANTHACMCTCSHGTYIYTAQSPNILFQVKSKGCSVHITTAEEEHFSQLKQFYITITITSKSNELQKPLKCEDILHSNAFSIVC